MRPPTDAESSLQHTLRHSAWAATLEPDVLDQVVRDSFERRVPVGGFAIRCGDPADHWIGLIDGLVKLSVSQADGRGSTLTAVTAGGWAGEGALLHKAERWRHDGVAIRPTRLACVPRHAFERLVSSSLAFNRFLLSQMHARVSLLMGLVECDRLLGPDARVARCLASLFDPNLHPRASSFVRLSQDEIGLLSSVSRQRTNKALHTLESEGLLRVEFGGVTVLDVAHLRDYGAGDALRVSAVRKPIQ